MTYAQAIDWLYRQLPIYQRVGISAYRKDLKNIQFLANHLDNPQNKFKSIHIAGTNGKGSCSHMLASILQESGYKVGLYTSPHLKVFRERIRVDGKMISKEKVLAFINTNTSFFKENNLSFFEMTVGLAFYTFATEKVDVAIIEVGMGGRLDSTNIISPDLSIITNIGFDHMQYLGNTLAKIAREKAGIIKENTPVVIGETQKETKPIFEEIAKNKNAKIHFADTENLPWIKSDLKGFYQKKNQKTVLKSIQILQTLGYKISENNIQKGLSKVIKNTGLQGRWQTIQQKPLCIVDTAHNLEGIKIVAQQLNTISYQKLHLVLGFVKDKDTKAILNLFPKNAYYYLSTPKIPRAKSLLELKEETKNLDLYINIYSSLTNAKEAAFASANKEDVIFIGGSIFTIAELIP